MSDRLAELVRQRALVEEHLAWLDRQIADAAPAAKPRPASDIPVVTTTVVPADAPPLRAQSVEASSVHAFPAAPDDADAIMAKYRIPSSALKDDVRKGCLLYFAAAFVVLGLGVMLLYLLVSNRH